MRINIFALILAVALGAGAAIAADTKETAPASTAADTQLTLPAGAGAPSETEAAPPASAFGFEDCGSDLECFTRGIETAQPSVVRKSHTYVKKGGITPMTETYLWKISDLSGDGGTFYFKNENFKYDFRKKYVEVKEEIAEGKLDELPALEYKQRKGAEGSCRFPLSEMKSWIEKWAQGGFPRVAAGLAESGKCSGELIEMQEVEMQASATSARKSGQ